MIKTEYNELTRRTKLFFIWDKGHTSINDNIIEAFKLRGVDFYYDQYFNLRGTWDGVDFYPDVRKAGADLYEIGAKVEHGGAWLFAPMEF